MQSIVLELPERHPAQQEIAEQSQRFNVACCGRRFGKSRLGIDLCIDPLLDGYPVGWFSPTYKMLSELWREIVDALKPITASTNTSEHRLELITGGVLDAWSLDSHDSARGRRYKRIIVDECAVIRNLLDAWNYVLRPTLIDYKGDAYFLSTPKGKNDFQALWDMGQDAAHGEWMSWRYPTAANPYLEPEEVEAMRHTMPARAYEQEIEARFIDEVSGALWKLALIDGYRTPAPPPFTRVVVAVDPAVSANANSDETGIVVVGRGKDNHAYVLADASGTYSPLQWAVKALAQYDALGADRIVAEVNNGGDLVEANVRSVRASVSYRAVRASRGKQTRAEPVAALYEQGRVHHVGIFPDLETQMTMWSPVDDHDSPDRVDALVWAITDLLIDPEPQAVRVVYDDDDGFMPRY